MKYVYAIFNKYQILGFVISGGINTVASYSIYVLLSLIIPFRIAYLIAYVSGVVFGYCLNARLVFNAPLSWQGLFAYPVVPLAQYIVSAMSLEFVIRYLHLSYLIAPLIIIMMLLPLNFVMSRFIINATRAVPTQ